MSDSTTFECIVPANNLDAFCNDLASLVETVGCDTKPNRKNVPAALLFQLLRALAEDRRDDECLTLAFNDDFALCEFQTLNPELRAKSFDKTAVGCFSAWLLTR